MSEQYTLADVAERKSEDAAWIVVEDGVYDVTKFLGAHPGGKKILLNSCGKDATESFWKFHNKRVLNKTAAKMKIGTVAPKAKL